MANQTATFPEFQPSGTETWSLWVERLENHLTPQKTTSDPEKKCAVIAYMGPAAFSKLNHKIQPEKTAKDLTFDEIVETVKIIFEPQRNIWSSRIEFRKLHQTAGESLLEFEGRLRRACIDGKWSAEELQGNLVEQFIAGIHDGKVRKSLLLHAVRGEVVGLF